MLIRFLYIALDVANNQGFDDRLFFHDTANNIASGGGSSSPSSSTSSAGDSVGRPPAVVALCPSGTVVLRPGLLDRSAVRVRHVAGAVVALGLLGQGVGGPRVGLIAAGLAAVSPLLIARDGSLLSESLYGLLVVLALVAAYRVLDRPVPRSAGLMGLLIGLASLTRGEALLFVPFLAIPICYRARPSGDLPHAIGHRGGRRDCADGDSLDPAQLGGLRTAGVDLAQRGVGPRGGELQLRVQRPGRRNLGPELPRAPKHAAQRAGAARDLAPPGPYLYRRPPRPAPEGHGVPRVLRTVGIFTRGHHAQGGDTETAGTIDVVADVVEALAAPDRVLRGLV